MAELLVEEAPGEATFDLVSSGEIVARSPMQLFWRRFRSDRVAMVSLGFIVFLIIVAIFAGPIVSLLGVTGPNTPNNNCPGPASQCALDIFGQPTGPSSIHPFGVDQLGRDVLARVIYGARISLEVAFIATGIAVLIGVTLGTIAGFFRGWVDIAALALHRCRPGLSGPAVRDRTGLGLRARQGLLSVAYHARDR